MELVDRLNTQTKRLKQLEKEVEQFRFEAIKNSIDTILTKAENVNGTKVISHSFENIGIELLRKVSDHLKQKMKSGIILLGSHTKGNASILLAVSDDLIKKGINVLGLRTSIKTAAAWAALDSDKTPEALMRARRHYLSHQNKRSSEEAAKRQK